MNPDHPIAPPRIDPARTPFQETVAFRRYGAAAEPDPDAIQDLYLRELIREQGFDGPPHVVPRRVLDRYIAAGETELFRGLSAAWHGDEFRTGDFFVGRGIYSGGASTAAGPHGLAVARQYARGGVAMRLSLKSDAGIADYEELLDQSFQEYSSALEQLRDQERAHAQRQASEAAIETVHAPYRMRRESLHVQHDDIGRFAAYRGYDALHVTERDYHVVLNRTVVRVQIEDLR